MARKQTVRKRVAAALKKYVRSLKSNPPGRRIRKRSTTVRNAKSVTVKQNADGTVHIKVVRKGKRR